MHHFAYRDGLLHAEDIPVPTIAKTVGTPFYCYSSATLRRHFRVFAEAFRGTDTLVAFSVKSLSNIAVLALLAKEGSGADVVSGGELKRVLAAGIAPSKIVFSGVGKKETEMGLALEAGIHQFNVESENELMRLNQVAVARGQVAPVALRVNPNVSAGGHDKISTGRAEDKFGIAWGQAEAVYARADALPGIEVVGIDVHIGSQITALEPFRAAFSKIMGLTERLRAQGHRIDRLDLGGGLGIPYQHDGGREHAASPPPAPPHPDQYARMIRAITAPYHVQLIFEPGRMIAGNAGILVSEVIYKKQGEARQFLILDAAMNDLIRPALYDAWHDIIPVAEPHAGVRRAPVDVVGPVCETGDTFARARNLPPMEEGALVAFLSAGAYGAVQASQYNSRPLIPEVLVHGDRHYVIRPRPDEGSLFKTEMIPPWLAGGHRQV